MHNALVPSSTLPVPPPPDSLVNHRKGRYQGDNLCLSLDEFVEEDRSHIKWTYGFLEQLFSVLKKHHSHASEETLAEARSFVANLDYPELLQCARVLGVTSLQSNSGELLAKTVHDLRGGALSALVGELQLADFTPLDDRRARQIFFLTRDHLKIMRNALLGLDDPKRKADLLPKMHGVDLILEKWRDVLLHNTDQKTHLEVTSDFHGNIAECCVEFGALDRILYNLVNNACRHTASGEVKLFIHAQPADCSEPENLRFCVSNPIHLTDERQLDARGDLNTLFQPGISSTGSGFGLTVALDFVTNAFGLGSRRKALEGGYLGANVADHRFNIWFHWPIVADV